MRIIIVFVMLALLGTGCVAAEQKLEEVVIENNDTKSVTPAETAEETNEETAKEELKEDLVILPIDPEAAWGYHATFKVFGQFVNDRFYGYHAGEDVEVLPEWEGTDIEVRAAADGYIVYKNWVSGYGGVVIIEHEIAGELYRSLYGHLDLSSITQDIGEPLQKGEVFALLGDPYSQETDGERQHLHFSVWKGESVQLAGYVSKASDLAKWLNPQDFYQL